MNDQPQPEKVKSCLDASLKKDLKAGPHNGSNGSQLHHSFFAGDLRADARDLEPGLQHHRHHLNLLAGAAERSFESC